MGRKPFHNIHTLCLLALPAEAKALRSIFSLQPVLPPLPWKAFANAEILLLIGGVGRQNAFTATRFALELLVSATLQRVLNIGIAGHRHWAAGSARLINRVVDDCSGRHWILADKGLQNVQSASAFTVNSPEIEFSKDGVYDMELAGIAEALQVQGQLQKLISLKIVSDNRQQSTRGLKARQVSDLVIKNSQIIEALFEYNLNP